MNMFQAALLGIVQGLTEFLPVSSSGHLVLAESLMGGFENPGVFFETFLHAGTTLAILVYFRTRLKKLDIKYLTMLVIGSVPAAIVGLLFQNAIELLFTSTLVVGIALIITGALNYLTDRATARLERVSGFDAAVVGIAQAFAIIPGISRSGSTIFAATSLGVHRETAAEFSFFLAIPAILGANVLQLLTHSGDLSFDMGTYMVGFACAFISGLIAIGVLMDLLTAKRFKFFSIYCIAVGVISIVLI